MVSDQSDATRKGPGPDGFTGDRFMIGGKDSGGGFALVEHRLAPHVLAAPLHLHTREDEYSYVLEGRLGALLGDHERAERRQGERRRQEIGDVLGRRLADTARHSRRQAEPEPSRSRHLSHRRTS